MKTVNMVSGGKSSASLMKRFEADFNVFTLVRIERPPQNETRYDCRWMFGKDEKTRKLIEDRIGCDFYGTAEDDVIIYTILDLEQKTGKEIKILTGPTFDEVLRYAGRCLPDPLRRFCTAEMKIKPVFEWWLKNFNEPIIKRIGYRKGEESRVSKMNKKTDANGLLTQKHIVGKRKTQNKWGYTKWAKPEFPLIKNIITHDIVNNDWIDNSVRFAEKNNCANCFNQNPLFLAWRAKRNKNILEVLKWAATKEAVKHPKDKWFKDDKLFIEQLIETRQTNLLDTLTYDDFSQCDTGFCGI